MAEGPTDLSQPSLISSDCYVSVRYSYQTLKHGAGSRGSTALRPRKEKEGILITFGEEDKSLIIHAKRGPGPRRRVRRVYTRALLRADLRAPYRHAAYVYTFLASTYRERDKSRGVRWTMVIS